MGTSCVATVGCVFILCALYVGLCSHSNFNYVVIEV